MLIGGFDGPIEAFLAFNASLLLAIVLDRLYPYHKGWALRLHPVRIAFHMARRIATPGSGALRGVLALLAPLVAIILPAWILLEASTRLLGIVGWIVASALILKVSLGDYLLYATVRRVAILLETGSLDEARREVQGIVRRDASKLGPGHVASAAVESLAENMVDAFTAPLLYAALLGPLGALAYRITNTVDGAIGYKTPEYEKAGRIPAALDTILNLIPARITALAIALASYPRTKHALRCIIGSRGATSSPNHWPPMAAMAGALGARLEKPGSHTICPRLPLPGAAQIFRALRIGAFANSIIIVTYNAVIILIGV